MIKSIDFNVLHVDGLERFRETNPDVNLFESLVQFAETSLTCFFIVHQIYFVSS